MANELRILASLAVDLGTSDPQPIDMSAYSRYVVVGLAFDYLAAALSSGATTIRVKNAGGTELGSFSLYSTSPVGSGSLLPFANSAHPIQPGGDLVAQVSQTLRPGNSVMVHVLGIELP